LAYLLDTNALLWSIYRPSELGRNARRILEGEPVIYYSPISIAELRIKERLGRVKLPESLLDELEANGFFCLSFDAKHAWDLSRFGTLEKHDPFDRMILAQASAAKAKLITSDEILLGLNFDWVIDSRK
jgi:PIN domain nuclease of toxin-antitoxin system